ncbi:MAG: diacylglycerol kinase family protein, partial [bacterium]
MKYSFIVNPKAGNGRTEKLVARLTSEIAIHQLDAEILVSQKPGHAIELASLSKGEIVIAVGGDGTVNEVANGIVGSSKVLAIIPSGSGNDMIKSLAIPNDFRGAFDLLMDGKIISMDCATVQCGASPPRYFLNGAGVGFDAAVAQRSLGITYLNGTLRYVVAVLQTLGKYRAPAYTIRLDSKTSVSRNLLIAIGNGRCAGGGFYL